MMLLNMKMCKWKKKGNCEIRFIFVSFVGMSCLIKYVMKEYVKSKYLRKTFPFI